MRGRPRIRRWGGFLVGALVVVVACRSAATEPRLCPETITVEERLAAPVTGWSQDTQPAPRQLVSITFFDGTPADQASLAPDSQSVVQDQQVAEWKLADVGARGVFVACGYERSGIVLSKRLDAKVTRCHVAYDPKVSRGGLPVIRGARCE